MRSAVPCRATASSYPHIATPSPARTSMQGSRQVPKLVAFDLDGTIWYPEMYMLDGGAPFRRDSTGAVYDAAGERIKLLGDTTKIFSELATDPAWADTQVAYVSRTEYPEWAIPCLQQFPIPGHPQGHTLYDISMHNEIYPGSKIRHFKQIHIRSGIDYEDMLFFDNERWNCTEVSKLGVKCVYTPRGMTAAAWKEGLALFSSMESGKEVSSGKHKNKQKVKTSARMYV